MYEIYSFNNIFKFQKMLRFENSEKFQKNTIINSKEPK
jgi:hypothetical protein